MKSINKYLVAAALLLPAVSYPQSPAAEAVKAEAPAKSDNWSKFRMPEIVFNNSDLSGDGQYFAQYIPNPDSLEKAVCLKVSQFLYKSSDEVPVVTKVVLTVKNMKGVAYTSGLKKPDEKTTVFSSSYLKSIMERLKDKEPVVNEIAGVITHETVHIYQKSSKIQTGDHGSVIEGIADAIRYYAGVDNISRRRKGGTWTGSYTTTGFFIVWLQEKYDKDFLYKLNKYVGETKEFKWDEAMMTLLNKNVQTLWDEYQAAI